MSGRFLDTSVLLQFLTGAGDDSGERAARLMRDVASGNEEIYISVTVVFEAAYILTKRYGVPRLHVVRHFLDLLNRETVVLPDKTVVLAALELWTQESPLSFADCYHLVLTKSLGLAEIYSFDKKMGRYPGVTRVEP